MTVRFAIAAATLLAAPAFAQPDVVVSAARTAPPAPSATVLERGYLAAINTPSLTDTLSRASGVRAFRKGGLGGSTYLALRGGEPNFTAVLLEGALVTDPTNTQGGGFDLSQLSPHLVEQVAIVPGALSAVQGAEALSGVVDIRLRSPGETLAGDLSADFDTDGGSDLAGTLSVPIGDGGILLGANRYDRFSEKQQSGLERTQFIGRATASAGPVALGATALRSDHDRSAFPEDSGGVLLAANREREQREGSFTLMAVDAVATKGALRPELRASWSRTDAQIDTPAIFAGVFDAVPALTSDTRFDRYQADAAIRWDAGQILSVAAGAGFVRETGDSEGMVDFGMMVPTAFDISRERVGVFAEATTVPVERLALTGSVRMDDPEDLSAEWTFRTAAEWQLALAGPSVFASYAEGYRLPSLFALAYPLLANPDLRPERSRTWEAGISQMVGTRSRVTLTYFDTRYTDLIDFDPAQFTNVNRAGVDTRGTEAKADIYLGPWSIRGTVSWLDVDVPPGTPSLRSRPEWQGSLYVSRAWQNGVNLALSLLGASDSVDSSIPTGVTELGGFVTVDAAAEVPVTDSLFVRAQLRNLFDETYQESAGVPALGITASIGAGVRF
ncbi:TonB-dependent receptor plug domain-containing protein [Pacificimonas sp. ICDLI1SI03]